jgi:NAD(P)-dependent dehydrogenase (short-subunit alcohol dehydrogenase family)
MVGDVEDASGTVEAIERSGGVARWVRCDVGVHDEVTSLRDATVAEFGAVNLVCSNVGVGALGALHEASDEEFELAVRVNVFGSFWVLKAFAPDLIAAASSGSRAQIMFTGSEHSLGVPPTEEPPFVPPMSVYTMTKHAMLGLAAVAQRDLQGIGVQVSILCPGWTATERLREYAAADEHLQMIVDTMSQEPDVVARLAFDGIDRGQLVIPTNPNSRAFVVATHREIIESMEAVTAGAGSSSP